MTKFSVPFDCAATFRGLRLGPRSVAMLGGNIWAIKDVVTRMAPFVADRRPVAQMEKAPFLYWPGIVHFFNRYDYLGKAWRPRVMNEGLVVTWYHGNPAHPAFRLMGDRLIRRMPFIDRITTSCSISARQLAAFGVPEDKLRLVPLGVDENVFRPVDEGARRRARMKLDLSKKAFCIGSFQKDGVGWGDGTEPKLIKGPDVFVDAAIGLSRLRNNVVVLLSGPSRGYVRKRLEDAGVKFVHHEFEHHADLVELYHALDAYVVASREEGGPLALLESMAAGVPVVSTRVGMSVDALEDGRNGFLVDVGDHSAIVKKLMIISAMDGAAKARLTGEARRDVLRYTWERCAETLVKSVYDDVQVEDIR